MVKLFGLLNSSYLIVEDHHYFIMHHNIKDRNLFGCTKHVIKLGLWFVHERDGTLYGFFHKLLARSGVKILFSRCRLSSSCSYLQECLEMVLPILLAHEIKDHINILHALPHFQTFFACFGSLVMFVSCVCISMLEVHESSRKFRKLFFKENFRVYGFSCKFRVVTRFSK